MKPIFTDSFNSLPTPLARSVFRALREATSLRPRPALAFGCLIDSAEIAIQLSAFSMVALADRVIDPDSESSIDARTLFQDTLLATPLSLGHYVHTCTVMNTALQNRDSDLPQVLIGLRDSLSTQVGDSGSIATRFAEFPGLRNRKKGHTFTIQDDDAQVLWEEWWPRLDAMLQALASLYTRYRLFTPQDNCDSTYEVVVLHGPQDLSTSSRCLIEADAALDSSSVYLCPSASLDSGRIGPETLCLSPLVRHLDCQLFLYQGRRGKRFMYLSADAVENNDAGSLEAQFIAAFPALTTKRSTTRLSPPKWHADFSDLDILCDASVTLAKPRPDRFYRGSPCSWADLSGQLDTPRSYLVSGDESRSLSELFDSHLRALLSEAHASTAPLVLIRGPAGSGKSTALARIGFYIWERDDTNVTVARLRSGARVAPDQLKILLRNAESKALVLLCDDMKLIAEDLDTLRKEARHQDVPVLIVAAERTYYGYFPATLELSLGPLNDAQIDALIDQLGTAGMLGALASLERDSQHEKIRGHLDRQLFVTMYEAVHAARFDEVIADEYARIPSQRAQQLYAAICISECAGVPLEETVALRMTGASVRAEFNQTWKHLADVARRDWFDGERVLRARHALIADALLIHISGKEDLYNALYDLASALSSLPGEFHVRGEAARKFAKIFSSHAVVESLEHHASQDDISQLIRLFAPRHIQMLADSELTSFTAKVSAASRDILAAVVANPSQYRNRELVQCYRKLRAQIDHNELAADLLALYEAYSADDTAGEWFMDQSMYLRDALALCSETTDPYLVERICSSLLVSRV